MTEAAALNLGFDNLIDRHPVGGHFHALARCDFHVGFHSWPANPV